MLRECEALLANAGQHLAPGSAHVTSAGALNARALIHCVASDDAHRSSEEIIRACVVNALARADERECKSMAMPVFATGHAHFNFAAALRAIAETLRDTKTRVEQARIVINDRDRLDDVRRVLGRVEVMEGEAEEPESFWESQ